MWEGGQRGRTISISEEHCAVTLTEEFERDGYVVVRGVLTAAEISRLRGTAERALAARSVPFGLGTTVPNAAVEVPDLGWLLHDDRVLDAVRTVLGADDLVFTLEAGVQRNLTGPWHKDLGTYLSEGGYYDCDDPFSREDCRVLKVGVYLQPHIDGRGLRVRPGSHRRASLEDGEERRVRTLPGDVVLFDVRITHRGQAPELIDRVVASGARVLPRARRDRTVATLRRVWNRVTGRPDRLAVFFAFGPDVEKTRTYGARNLARELDQLGRDGLTVPETLQAAFGARGVELIPVA